MRWKSSLNINNQNIEQYFQNYIAARAIVRRRVRNSSRRSACALDQPVANSSQIWADQRVGTSGTGARTGKFRTHSIRCLGNVLGARSVGQGAQHRARKQFAAQVSAADLANRSLIEQASLAQFLFEIRGQDALQKLFDETVAADRKTVELAQAQYDTGVDERFQSSKRKQRCRTREAGGNNVAIEPRTISNTPSRSWSAKPPPAFNSGEADD